jgi:REP element-mobilizing transposase RayT
MKNPKPILGKLIRHYKARTTRMIHDAGFPEFQWQRNYYEHIIRDQKDLNAIRRYIHDNPAQWYLDNENPNNIKREAAQATPVKSSTIV